jgi:hypothetical protein
VTSKGCAVSIGRLLDDRSGVALRLATAAGLTAALVAWNGGVDRGIVAASLVADSGAATVESDRCKRLGTPIRSATAPMPTSAYVTVRDAAHFCVTGAAAVGFFVVRATVFFVERG